MDYIEVQIETTHYGVEVITAKLMTIGITDLVIDDPFDAADIMAKKEDYEWDYVEDDVKENLDRNPKVFVYMEDTFENRGRVIEIEDAIADIMDEDIGTLKVTAKYENDQEWKDKWKEFFKPSKIAPGLVVKPSWEEYIAEPGEKVIEIDPGMAFGTGGHETTSLCTRMIQKYMKNGDMFLDVGTGSGILLIAAALLGAKEALGIDIDPVAVEVAQENVNKNHVEETAKVIKGDLTAGVDFKADIVAANLMADLVEMLSADVNEHMVDGGIFISSGILNEKCDRVKNTIEDNGFEVIEVVQDGEWCAIVAKAGR